MEQEKNYSLLRPFDLEAAKHGEAICDVRNNTLLFLAEAGDDGEHAIRAVCGNVALVKSKVLRMKPLCWVEGRPVYKGDVLYCGDKRVVAEGPIPQFNRITEPGVGFKSGNTCFSADCFTWTPPKVKREGWVNIYKDTNIAFIHDSESEADRRADSDRIACIRIEWEE